MFFITFYKTQFPQFKKNPTGACFESFKKKKGIKTAERQGIRMHRKVFF